MSFENDIKMGRFKNLKNRYEVVQLAEFSQDCEKIGAIFKDDIY